MRKRQRRARIHQASASLPWGTAGSRGGVPPKWLSEPPSALITRREDTVTAPALRLREPFQTLTMRIQATGSAAPMAVPSRIYRPAGWAGGHQAHRCGRGQATRAGLKRYTRTIIKLKSGLMRKKAVHASTQPAGQSSVIKLSDPVM